MKLTLAERMKTLEYAERLILCLRDVLEELDLLMSLPANIPETVRRTDTGKELGTFAHNLLGWVLSIVIEDEKKTRRNMDAQKRASQTSI